MNTHMILIIFLFLGFYILLELVQRKFKLNTEYTRKVAHVLSAIAAIIASNYLSKPEFITITIIFLFLFILSYYFRILKSIHYNSSPTHKNYGEVLYPLSIILIAQFLYEDKILFILGLLILGISDSMAWLGGKIAKKNHKTILGSLLYFITTLIILATVVDIIPSLIISLALTIVERYSTKGSDNITVPIAYILLVSLLQI